MRRRHVRAVPGLLQLYDLLALVAASVDGVARLVAWEEPWRRVFATTNGRRIAARAPAMAELTCARAGDGSAMTDRFLLLPDIGRLSVATSGRSLRALAQLQRLGEDVPDIVVATRDPERADAWEMQFERLGLSGSARPAALATPWSRAISDACHLAVREARGEKASFTAAGSSVATTVHAIASVAAPPTGAVWSTETVRVDAALNISELAVLDLVGRHAFISSSVVGQVLGRDGRWVAARRRSLARRGLVRVVSTTETGLHGNANGDHLELTERGLRVLAAQLGMPLQRAVTLFGVAGGGPETPVGSRYLLLRHLLHTVGADDFFGHLAEAARDRGLGELIEWRNAAASAHARVRPDGYGLLRIGQREYGFFLEYDRGTVRPASLRAKFAAYQRYCMSARAERDYDGFPDVLVVTAGGAEDRITDAIASVGIGSTWQPRTFVTTLALLRVTRAGPLGPVWRVPGFTANRVSWPVTTFKWDFSSTSVMRGRPPSSHAANLQRPRRMLTGHRPPRCALRRIRTALLNGGAANGTQIISQASLDATWTPIVAMGEGARQYGLGWGISDIGGERVLEHSGSVDTAGSYFVIAPDQRIAVGVLANLTGEEKAQLAMDVLSIALGNEPSPTTPALDWRLAASRFTPNLDVWSAYFGAYRSAQGMLRVYREGSQLHLASSGLVFDLVPLSDSTFILLGDESAFDEVPAEFRRDTNGSIGLYLGGSRFGVKA